MNVDDVMHAIMAKAVLLPHLRLWLIAFLVLFSFDVI